MEKFLPFFIKGKMFMEGYDMTKEKQKDFPAKKFIKNRKQNKDLKRILQCIGEKHGMITSDGSVKYSQIKKLICKTCKEDLNVEVTTKQISRLLKLKNKFPYKAIAILMTCYNLLKRQDGFSNEPELENLLEYIKQINGSKLLYQELCLKREVPQQIYRYHEYAKDPRYSEIYELYVGSYETMNEKLGDKSFFNICKYNLKEKNQLILNRLSV